MDFNLVNLLGYLESLNLNTDQCMNIAPNVLLLVKNLKDDKEYKNIMSKKVSAEKLKQEGKTEEQIIKIGQEVGTQITLELSILLLSKYKEYVYKILAVAVNKKVDEIKAQKVSATLDQLSMLLANKHLRDFFSYAGSQNQQES